MKSYYVYMMASKTRVIYIGVTSNLLIRYWQHKKGVVNSFSKRYKTHKLIYFETTTSPISAIGREKQLKGWRRERKVALIEANNPEWEDLAKDWKV